MDLALRPAVPNDYPVLASWIPDAHACGRWAGPLLQFPFCEEDLETLLWVDGALSFTLENRRKVMHGFGQILPRGHGWFHLGRIIVSPARRGRGIGRILVTSLMNEAVKRGGRSRLTLRVYRDNVPAISLYESLGFLPVDALGWPESLFMELRLDRIPGSADA